MFIEVFRTSLLTEEEADNAISLLQELVPGCRASVDLEDCDRVLRVAAERQLDVALIMAYIKNKGHHIAILDGACDGLLQ
jgi:hypothetical protein